MFILIYQKRVFVNWFLWAGAGTSVTKNTANSFAWLQRETEWGECSFASHWNMYPTSGASEWLSFLKFSTGLKWNKFDWRIALIWVISGASAAVVIGECRALHDYFRRCSIATSCLLDGHRCAATTYTSTYQCASAHSNYCTCKRTSFYCHIFDFGLISFLLLMEINQN